MTARFSLPLILSAGFGAVASLWLYRPHGEHGQKGLHYSESANSGASAHTAISRKDFRIAVDAQKTSETILEQLKTDPQKAAELAWKISDLNLRRELLLEITSRWICQDPGKAMAWILKLPETDFELSDELLCGAAENFASIDPLKSAEWLSQVRSDSRASESMLSVIQIWSAVRPQEVAKLVERFPEGGLRVAAMDSVARDWMKQDPTTAYIWMKGLPEVDRLIAHLDQP